MHSFIVAKGYFVNKKPRISNHNIFLYSCQDYGFEATNHKLNSAHFTWVLEKVLFVCTASCVYADWLTRQPITCHRPRRMLLTMKVHLCLIIEMRRKPRPSHHFQPRMIVICDLPIDDFRMSAGRYRLHFSIHFSLYMHITQHRNMYMYNIYIT